MGETIRVEIFRFDPESEASGSFKEYTLEKDVPGMRILMALNALNQKQEANISYRFSCEEWQCGSCAIQVNGVPKLACKEEIHDGDRLEPLPVFPVIKDLMVDLSQSFEKHVELARLKVKETGDPLDYDTQSRLWESINCMQCDICVASCPMMLTTGNSYSYTGQEYMIQLYRMEFDPRYESEALRKTIEDGLWECFTCRQCENNCPQRIPLTKNMVDLRSRVMEKDPTLLPPTIRDLNENLFKHGNEFGVPRFKRTEWTGELEVPQLQDGEKEYLYFVGCSESSDQLNQAAARAMVNVLNRLQISYGILGEEEVCASDAALQTGEVDLFEELAETNIKTFKKYNVSRVITSSPHVYHIIKNEYPQYGGEYEVMHYVQLLEKALKEGKLEFNQSINQTVTYHDPCFLGRYNEIYEAPRKVLQGLPGVELVEMEKNREQAECCGGGGGGMWMEIPPGERVSERRVQQAADTGAGVLVVACPWCCSMFDDAIKNKGLEEKLQVKHILELIDEALQ